MTSLDLIHALMVGAGISQFQAAKVLGEHDREIARNALASATRRDAFAQATLTGLLAAHDSTVPPEELVGRALQYVDIVMKETSK